MNRHEIAYRIAAIMKESCVDNVSVSEMEETMNRSQIIKKYGDDIKQLKDGRYHIRHQGRQIFKKTFDLVIDEILRRENEEGVRTLDSIADDFFEYRYTSSSSGTYGKDKTNYETFIKGTELSKKDITKIILNDGVRWASHCLQVKPDMKEKYFKNVRGTLNQMLKFCIDNGYITQNPVSCVTIHKDHFVPKTKRSDDELKFEDWESKKVCEIAYSDFIKSSSILALAIPFLFQTGLRDGELCGLKWKDVTLKGLHVQGEMVESRDKENKFLGYRYVGHTKTPAGNRIIPLNREAIKILSWVREYNSENKWPTGEDDFIFLREHKGIVCPCTTRCFESRIKKYCRKAEMDVLKSQHDVRRTFATNLFYSGMNPKNIQALMGHENLEQTMDYIKRKDINENVLNYLEGISSGVDILKVV